ncbi:PAS domain-containing protein [Clostridium sp. AM58-1XD]|uniref:PAS domain-containing protein n=1 Tax=Clostridium sp. AM58-1XD TaxID=2292307 RepID=UPI000E4AED69|nr:PAS domain-containing protein [Clostridium sp. AM58-1XD]RGY99437.1 diguanylate cyclase [Clostridium sp. AM58-1XD]
MKKVEIENGERKFQGGYFDCIYDEYFTLLRADNVCDFLGYTRDEMEEIFHNHLIECIYQDDRQMIKKEIALQLAKGNVFMYENRLNTKGGEIRWVWISAELRENRDCGPYFHCIFHDITDVKKERQQLAISEQRYEIVLSQMQDIIFELDCKTFDIYYSPNFEKKFGYQIPVKGFPDSMFSTDIIYEDDKAVLRQKFQGLLQGSERMQQEYRIKHKDGYYLWMDVHATVMRSPEGELLKILGIISDIHQRKTEILETRKIANLDPLTGLLNRRESVKRINQYIEHNEALAALIIIDVDDFKRLNDTMGHLYGDSVLSDIAEGLLTIFRHGDIIARFGGDEFLVFMPHLREKNNVTQKLEDILNMMKHSSRMERTFSCSIGACFYPDHGDQFSTLFSKADAAMYHAKRQGKGMYCFYNEGELPTRFLSVSHRPLLSMQKSFHDHIIEYMFRIFLENPDTHRAIPILLDYIGRVLHSNRIYICQKTGGEDFRNIYRWCSAETLPKEESLNRLYSLNWEITPEISGTAIPDAGKVEDPEIRGWLEERNVKAIFLCWLGDKDQVMNLIGYEDCHNTRQDVEEERYTLFMASEILNLFLVKQYNSAILQKQNNERISFLMDSIPGGMLGVYLRDGFPLYFINPRMLGYLGFETQEEYDHFIEGNAANGIYKEDRKQVTAHILKSLKAGGEYETEYRMIKKDGELIWVSDKGKKIQTSDGKEAVLSLRIDISEQKEYENQLTIYRNASNGGAFVISMDGNYPLLYANDIFYHVFETSREHVAAMDDKVVSFIHPDDRLLARRLLEEARADHKDYFQWALRIITGKGRLKWILVNASLEKSEDGLVMDGFVIDVTEKHRLEDEIAHKELVYRTALKETHINVWEYDVKNHTLILTESAEEHHSFKGTLEGVPESLLDKGCVHPSSRQDLIEMYQKLDRGEPHIQADILTRTCDLSGWWWERINYTSLYDKNGAPAYAVAVGEDITNQKKAEMLYQQDMQLRMMMNAGMIICFRCNLDQNRVEYIDGPDTDQYGDDLTYDDLLRLHNLYVANKEDRVRFLNAMSKEALYSAFQNGMTMISCEYRRRDRNGRLFWVSASARLMRNAQDGSLYVYGTLQDIDERKNIELALKNRAERDMLTGVYNKETAILMIEETVHKEQKRKSNYAMMVFNVDNFTGIVHDDGYAAADNILKEMGNLLNTCSSSLKIVGRFYGDEFVVLLYDSPSAEEVMQYAENVRKDINQPICSHRSESRSLFPSELFLETGSLWHLIVCIRRREPRCLQPRPTEETAAWSTARIWTNRRCWTKHHFPAPCTWLRSRRIQWRIFC